MATPTLSYMNSGGWTYTPQGGSPIPIPKVKDWSLDSGINRVRDSADYDLYTTVSVIDHMDPTITLSTLHAFALLAIGPDVIGTLFGIVRDATNGALAGGGAVSLTLINASKMSEQSSGSHRQLARKSLSFCSFSPDGQTSPVVITAL